MKKIFSLIFSVVLILTLLLFGVSCKEPEVIVETVTETVIKTVEVEEVMEEEKESVTIQFWSRETDPPTVEVYAVLKSEFEREYPWITLNIQYVGEDIETKIPTAIMAGADWDVSHIGDIVQRLAMEDQLLPLNDVYDEHGGVEAFFGDLIHDTQGNPVTLCLDQGGPVFWIRKDIFEERGIPIPSTDYTETWTWDEALDAIKQATYDSDNDGEIDQYGISIPAGSTSATRAFIQYFFYNNGIDMFDEDLNVILDHPRIQESLEYYLELLEYAPPGASEASWYEVIDGLTSGKCSTAIYYGRVLGRLYTDAPDLVGKVIAVPLPHNENFITVTAADPDYIVAYAKTKHPEEVKLWLSFLARPENNARVCATVPGHLLPTNEATQDALMAMNIPELVENPEIMDVLFDVPKYQYNARLNAGGFDYENKQLIATQVVNPFSSVSAYNSAIITAMQKVYLQGEDIETALAAAQVELEEAIEEAKAELAE